MHLSKFNPSKLARVPTLAMSDIYINASDKKLSHSKKTSPAFQVFMKVL